MKRKYSVYYVKDKKWKKIGVAIDRDTSISLWFYRDVPLETWLVALKKEEEDDDENFFTKEE